MAQIELFNFAPAMNYKGIETIPGMTFAYMTKEHDDAFHCDIYSNVLIMALDLKRHSGVRLERINHLFQESMAQYRPNPKYLTDMDWETQLQVENFTVGDVASELSLFVEGKYKASLMPTDAVYQERYFKFECQRLSDGLKNTYSAYMDFVERKFTLDEYLLMLAEINNTPHPKKDHLIVTLANRQHFGLLDQSFPDGLSLRKLWCSDGRNPFPYSAYSLDHVRAFSELGHYSVEQLREFCDVFKIERSDDVSDMRLRLFKELGIELTAQEVPRFGMEDEGAAGVRDIPQ